MNYFVAEDDGILGLAPPFPGDLLHIPLEIDDSWVLFSGAFVAGSASFETDTKFQGLKKGLFSGEKMFMLILRAVEKPGDLFIGSNGAFIEINLAPGQVFNCDNGHLVAMETSVSYDIKRVGGWKSTFFSGEGVIVQLTGPGRVIMQSRNPHEFAMWMYRLMPKPSSSSSGSPNIQIG